MISINNFLYNNHLLLHLKRCYSYSKRKVLLQNNTRKIIDIKYNVKNRYENRLYVWGLAETGALGINHGLKKHAERNTAFVQHPTRHKFAEQNDLIHVACGYGFSLFTVRSGDDNGISLFGTGINTDSQLGNQKNRLENTKYLELLISPSPISLPKIDINEQIQIICCAAGRAHSLALSESGTVYSFGNNSYGQCGRSIIENEEYGGNSTIHRIENLGNEKIKMIECGQDHSMFITTTGRVYSSGWGADGQTGTGHYNTIDIPAIIKGDISTENIVKVACSSDCVLALNDKGEVFGWGNSEYGQLKCIGDNQQINSPQFLESVKGIGKIVDIASGGSICLVLNENGDVFAWGYGILGFGPNIDHTNKPKQIPATLFGRNDFNPNSKVISIFSGINHMGAINDEGDLFMWGKNKYGCLGFGQTNDQYFPFKTSVGAKVLNISCGVDHTLALCKSFIK